MGSSNLCRGTPYFQYQKVIQTYGDISGNFSKKFLSEKFSSPKWLYSKNLVGHTGCVNALAFSNHGGEFLVSGGDDTRVLVWKLCEAVTGKYTTARCLKQQHHSNIFCVSFDSDNRHIITAGNDEVILRHDFESGEVVRSFEAEAETNELCIHPEDNHVFIAAESSFGAVTLFDVRTPTEPIVLAVSWTPKTKLSQFRSTKSSFYSAKFNPVDPTLIATGNDKNGVQLWDTRFPKRCLKHFDPSAGAQHVMSVSFDQTGRYIAAFRKSLPPVLYHIDRDTSLAEFYDKGYSNSVTRKSICFAGQKDEFIVTGSEDFNIYLWEVPKLCKDHVGIAKVEQSSLALKGHRSIVNQVCFNQDTAMICSSGIEKIIKMWSPFQMVGGISGDRECKKRKLYTHDDYYRFVNESLENLESDLSEDSTSEDQGMLALADQWLNMVQQAEYASSDDGSDIDESDMATVAGQVNGDYDEMFLYSEIGHSPESTDSDSVHAGGSERISQNAENPDRNSVNPRHPDSNSENTGNPASNSENVGNAETTSENAGRADINSDNSDGVGLERLREIIASQDHHPRNASRRIAELRKNCLKE